MNDEVGRQDWPPPMRRKFNVGDNVKVIEDTEDPESGWVGAEGQVIAFRDGVTVIKVMSGNPNPDDGNVAWFSESELQRDDDKGWDPVGS